MFFKIKEVSSQGSLEDSVWISFNADGNADNNDLASAENSSSPVIEKQSSYQEFSYTATNLPEFTSFAIKLVMKSSEPSYPPKVQDIRVVASY